MSHQVDSITSLCNLNCIYCNTGRVVSHNELMSYEDIVGILEAGFRSGIRKVSWTGGEPTVRKDFLKIVKKARDIGFIHQSLTTNGVIYSEIAEELKIFGLTKVNFSLDTLNPEEYKKICGFDGFSKVIKSIEKAVTLYDRIKINCVATKLNRKVIGKMINYFDDYGDSVVVRFLEIVPCGQMYEDNQHIFEKEFLPAGDILGDMRKIGNLEPVNLEGDVPKSMYFKIAGKMGIYGVNPNFSVDYVCDRDRCKKIRVSPHGFVSNCTTDLKYVRDFRNKTTEQKNKLMKEIVNEKAERSYEGFRHEQKYYDFWRFGLNPGLISKKFYDIKKNKKNK